MLTLLTLFALLPFLIPSLALPTVRNNVPPNSTAPSPKRKPTSAIVSINIPIYTSMLPLFSNQGDSEPSVLVGPGTIGLQIWEGDLIEHEWKISEKAINDDGDASVDAWSLQCHLILTSSVISNSHFVFTLSPKSPFISGSVDSEIVFECNDLQCLKDGVCDKDYDPSFNSVSLNDKDDIPNIDFGTFGAA
ncbi:hypothetical protein C356_04685 [Cryptococcus neoformans c45]|nr:hypothetical protein C356_04685 [Cryptococcus neoformans var. grubii c45]